MSDALIAAENVSKKFSRRLRHALWYGFWDLGSELVGVSNGNGDLRVNEYWAVREVSFEVRRGECLGIVGHNGAGKSTLLRILNGLLRPDQGRVAIQGRIGALMQLGAGFNPILTGRENIYINGTILGFTRQELEKRLDAIIDFAEIREYIDSPVQNYSAGMKLRLAFAIVAQMEPDVLLIDEVMAVGDYGFQVKCTEVLNRMCKNAAVILVTHGMETISARCTDILVMDHGQVTYQGKGVQEGIQRYYGQFQKARDGAVAAPTP